MGLLVSAQCTEKEDVNILKKINAPFFFFYLFSNEKKMEEMARRRKMDVNVMNT